MRVVCVQAFGSHVPGDDVEMPDGSVWSELYYAEPYSAQALRAKADAAVAALAAVNAAEAAQTAPEAPPEEAPAPEPPEPPEPAEAVTEAPDAERVDG